MKPGAIARSSPNHLRAWRVAVGGLTQAQVEKVLGWQQSRVSHLECGNAVITEEVLQSLAPLYNCTPAALLGPPPKEGEAHPQAGGALYETEPMLDRLLAEIGALKLAAAGAMDSAEKAIEILRRTEAVLSQVVGRNLVKETADADDGQ